MLFPSLSHLFLLGLACISNISAQSDFDDIDDPTKRAELAVLGLMQWYDGGSGLWETTGWWNAANIITMMGNLAKVEPQNEYFQMLARTVFAVAVRHAPTKNPNPGVERPGNSSLMTRDSRAVGTGYHKSVDPVTNVIHTFYPAGWNITSDHRTNMTNLVSTFGQNLASDTFVPDPYDFLDGYYDDDLWWALAWITAYDVTHHKPYLTLAEGIFAAVTKSWPTKCNDGGIYWNMTSGYVNAIANELFFSTAAHLANRIRYSYDYEYWAYKALTWFKKSGMINSNGTINDGLDENCRNNNGTVWSYNQGVILGGLVELATGWSGGHYPNPHLVLATNIALPAIKALSDYHMIIHDVCENENCGADGSQFKGIFMRNLVELLKVTKDADMWNTIMENAESIWDDDKQVDARGKVLFGVNWDRFVGVANASTHSSAMDALVADLIQSGMTAE
jgi:predicted alpha-1,6-mannanase (GH76 family)